MPFIQKLDQRQRLAKIRNCNANAVVLPFEDRVGRICEGDLLGDRLWSTKCVFCWTVLSTIDRKGNFIFMYFGKRCWLTYRHVWHVKCNCLIARSCQIVERVLCIVNQHFVSTFQRNAWRRFMHNTVMMLIDIESDRFPHETSMETTVIQGNRSHYQSAT